MATVRRDGAQAQERAPEHPRLVVSMPAKLDELAGLQAEVAQFGAANDWPADWEFQVELAIEELVVNIVNYGFKDGGDGRIELVLNSAPDALTIDIVDNGRPFDPFSEAPPPDLDSGVEDRPIGGLGVHFVKTMMDDVRYAREAQSNHVTLVKRRGDPSE